MINLLLGSASVWYGKLSCAYCHTGTQPAASPRYDTSHTIIYCIIPPLHLITNSTTANTRKDKSTKGREREVIIIKLVFLTDIHWQAHVTGCLTCISHTVLLTWPSWGEGALPLHNGHHAHLLTFKMDPTVVRSIFTVFAPYIFIANDECTLFT